MTVPKWLADEYNEALFNDSYIEKQINGDKKILLFRKLFDDTAHLKTMWLSVLKKYDSDTWLMDFYGDVMDSLEFPSTQKISDKKLTKNIEKLKKLTDSLAELLGESGLDMPINKSMTFEAKLINQIDDKELLQARESSMQIGLEPMAYTISDFLHDLPLVINEKLEKERLYMASNSQKAEQTYFIRAFTSRMQKRFNQPMREICAIVAYVIFDNQKIDFAYVANVAP